MAKKLSVKDRRTYGYHRQRKKDTLKTIVSTVSGALTMCQNFKLNY